MTYDEINDLIDSSDEIVENPEKNMGMYVWKWGIPPIIAI